MEVLRGRRPHQLKVRHIAGHGHPDQCEDPAEAWLTRWNCIADDAAKHANTHRDPAFQRLWQHYEDAEQDQLHRLRQLQALHLDVAQANEAHTASEPPTTEDAEPLADDGFVPIEHSEAQVNWITSLPPDWLTSLEDSSIEFRFGVRFPAQVLHWLSQEASEAPCALHVSWIECVVVLRTAGIVFPVPAPSPHSEAWRDPDTGTFAQNTLAADIHLIRSLFRAFAGHFVLDIGEVCGLNLSTLGIGPPQAGLPAGVLARANKELGAFCSCRPIKSSNDLTRPFW